MSDLLLNIVPLLFLLILGVVLCRIGYFQDAEIQKITAFIGDFLVPCVIFNSILNLDIRGEHIALSIGFCALLALLMAISWLVYRLFHLPHRFFIFYSSAFAFGLMGIPLFTTVFGAEHMEYLVALGVGHELFFAVVYLTAAKIVLAGDKFQWKMVARNLVSPLFCMVLIALFLNLSGFKSKLESTILGSCVFATITNLASVTTVLTMIAVGYRICFRGRDQLKTSIQYAAFRVGISFCVGYAFKWLVLDRLVAADPYYDYAFFTMISQFGSTLLLVLVGKYGTREEMEISSNAFVLNALGGIVVYFLYVLYVGVQLG